MCQIWSLKTEEVGNVSGLYLCVFLRHAQIYEMSVSFYPFLMSTQIASPESAELVGFTCMYLFSRKASSTLTVP